MEGSSKVSLFSNLYWELRLWRKTILICREWSERKNSRGEALFSRQGYPCHSSVPLFSGLVLLGLPFFPLQNISEKSNSCTRCSHSTNTPNKDSSHSEHHIQQWSCVLTEGEGTSAVSFITAQCYWIYIYQDQTRKEVYSQGS